MATLLYLYCLRQVWQALLSFVTSGYPHPSAHNVSKDKSSLILSNLSIVLISSHSRS